MLIAEVIPHRLLGACGMMTFIAWDSCGYRHMFNRLWYNIQPRHPILSFWQAHGRSIDVQIPHNISWARLDSMIVLEMGCNPFKWNRRTTSDTYRNIVYPIYCNWKRYWNILMYFFWCWIVAIITGFYISVICLIFLMKSASILILSRLSPLFSDHKLENYLQ